MALLNDSIELGMVSLRVQGLKKMRDFYTRIIGFEILSESEDTVILGVSGTPYVRLHHVEGVSLPDRAYTGLYHIAILLPDEQDLGQIIYHFYRVNFQIDGAGDHAFSQALYMSDPEGNGIEIYADRGLEAWNVQADGSIPPVTDPVDIQRLIELVDQESWEGLPKGTKVGHVHLQVADVEKAREFYVDLLGMDVKTEGYGALFVSRNGYHHHLGINAWAGKNSPHLDDTTTGLEYYTLKVDNLDEIEKRLSEKQQHFERNDTGITLEDGNGIRVNFVLI